MNERKDRKKSTFYHVLNHPAAKVALATSLLISTGASITTPLLIGVTQQAEAANTKTFTSTESTSQTQTQTFTVPDITKLNGVTSNTGSVEIVSVVGDQVTVKMTGGTSTGSVQTGGAYIAEESKMVTDSSTSSSNVFASTKAYNNGGFSGTLSKTGAVTSDLISGSYTPADSKFITGQPAAYYNVGGYMGSLSQYLYSGSYIPGDTRYEFIEKIVSLSEVNGLMNGSIYYSSGAYSGLLNYTSWTDYNGMAKVFYGGYISTPGVDTRVYKYQGTVTKPASDTRVYSYTQNYSGTVTKPALDTRTYANAYQYNLTFDYETDRASPSISLIASSITPTNQNVEVQVKATDAGGLKQVKWAKGNQTEVYFTTKGTPVENNTFTAIENDTYTVFAEDLSGNKTVENIVINNIDTIAPNLAVIAADTSDLTNQDVVVNVSFPVDATLKEYRLNEGPWTPYTSTLTLNANGKIEARSSDAVGNVSEIATYLVENVDKVDPAIQSVSIINDYLAVVTSDVGSTVAKTEVKLDDGSYQDYQDNQIKLIQNTEVTVRVTDQAGNVTEESFSLTSDAYYQDLLDQIEALQTEIDRGGQNKTELEDLLITIDKIKQDAGNLVLPSEQTDIENKATDLAKQIQAILDALDEAKVELEDLGDNPTQIELDKAKDIVDALPPGPGKDDLLKELEEKQNQKDLQDAKDLVDNLGDNPTQAEIDHARDIVEDLVDSEGKNDLLDIINDKQDHLDSLIEEATKAVEDLHDRSAPEEVQHAKDLINELPNGPEKDALLDKLKEKEQAIKDRLTLDELLANAEAAVKHAEAFPANFNIEQAEKAVNILPEIPEKEPLLERIQTIKDNVQLSEATKKVEQAERYERDPYLADAIKLVDNLKESDGKQALKDRLQVILDKLKAQQDAEDEAKGDDGKFNPADPDRSIEDAIDTIQDLDAKNYLTRWHKANNNASKYFSRAMTANATKFQQELPASYLAKASYANLIKELSTRTVNLANAWLEASKDKAAEQLFSKAYTLVDLYESSKTERNYKNAVAAIADLPDGLSKTAIETQLASLKNHIEEDNSVPTVNSKEAIEQADKAVTNYEKYKSSYYQKKATEAVEALTDSEEKTALLERLEINSN